MNLVLACHRWQKDSVTDAERCLKLTNLGCYPWSWPGGATSPCCSAVPTIGSPSISFQLHSPSPSSSTNSTSTEEAKVQLAPTWMSRWSMAYWFGLVVVALNQTHLLQHLTVQLQLRLKRQYFLKAKMKQGYPYASKTGQINVIEVDLKTSTSQLWLRRGCKQGKKEKFINERK